MSKPAKGGKDGIPVIVWVVTILMAAIIGGISPWIPEIVKGRRSSPQELYREVLDRIVELDYEGALEKLIF